MSLLQTSVTNVGPALTIIGKDLDAGSTFNADVTLGAGPLKAGIFMKYDPVTRALAKATVTGGTPDVVYGILADNFDDTGSTTPVPAMVYRDGCFLRQEIEAANNVPIPPGSAIETALLHNGITLELSYDSYVGLTPPGGVEVPITSP
jgi:hypothetical protein